MSEVFSIFGTSGAKKLAGKIQVKGGKNAALPILAAALLFEDKMVVENVPNVDDVFQMVQLLSGLGIKVCRKDTNCIALSCDQIIHSVLDYDPAVSMRASIILTGPLLARFGRVSFPYPGGCSIGNRPIDLFLEGFQKMGARFVVENGIYNIQTQKCGLVGAEIFFRFETVTGTETFILAALLARGKTILKNCVLEPEVQSLIALLNDSGADIRGHGTKTLEIRGGTGFLRQQKKHKIIPDRIETGSFLILASLAARSLEITECNPSHMESLIEHLVYSGVNIQTCRDRILVTNESPASLKPLHIRTQKYPGFPTDLHAPMAVFLTQAQGRSSIFETIFDGRLKYVKGLKQMGANINKANSHRITVNGKTPLVGTTLEAPDLRAGFAFIIAATIASGKSVIENSAQLDRGYESIEKRLQSIGVRIRRL